MNFSPGEATDLTELVMKIVHADLTFARGPEADRTKQYNRIYSDMHHAFKHHLRAARQEVIEALEDVVDEGNKQARADMPGVFPDYAYAARDVLKKLKTTDTTLSGPEATRQYFTEAEIQRRVDGIIQRVAAMK